MLRSFLVLEWWRVTILAERQRLLCHFPGGVVLLRNLCQVCWGFSRCKLEMLLLQRPGGHYSLSQVTVLYFLLQQGSLGFSAWADQVEQWKWLVESVVIQIWLWRRIPTTLNSRSLYPNWIDLLVLLVEDLSLFSVLSVNPNSLGLLPPGGCHLGCFFDVWKEQAFVF